MDLLTAVAVSLLPVSRLRAAGVYKDLRQAYPATSLEAVAAALGCRADSGSGVHETLNETRERAEAALRAARELGIEPVPWFDRRYPALLACISDPPPVLWAKGNLALGERPAVAIVGSRAVSSYGFQVARRLAAELADRGIVVVSGLARGADSAAHTGCLDADGATLAVTGCGLDRVYPSENKALSARIADGGLLVTELPPGAPPRAEHFPLRNRIISGISLAVVVVEANEKSGSLITAGCALRQGRDVMAVPGSILTGRNRGSHGLLKDGARIVETADDILDELGWRVPPEPSAVPGRIGFCTPAGRSRPPANDPLLSRMDAGEAYALDDLVEATGITASRLLPRLMELELLGFVDAPGGGRFVRR